MQNRIFFAVIIRFVIRSTFLLAFYQLIYNTSLRLCLWYVQFVNFRYFDCLLFFFCSSVFYHRLLK